MSGPPTRSPPRAKRRRLVLVAGIAAAIGWYVVHTRSQPQVLTGLVTTDDVLVSPLVIGRMTELKVQEGDAVKRGQLLAVLSPGELQADRNFFASSAKSYDGQVQEGEAALRYQERQRALQIH